MCVICNGVSLNHHILHVALDKMRLVTTENGLTDPEFSNRATINFVQHIVYCTCVREFEYSTSVSAAQCVKQMLALSVFRCPYRS